jgi:Uncharacterized conserved protein (DUF2203)
MKRRRRTKRGTLRAIRLWTYPETAKALPYLRSITNSLRDHWLELQSKQLDGKRLHAIPRPSRRELIALEENSADARQAEDKFEDALAELMKQDVFLLDPVQGLALIPFQQEEELAWYVFDAFAENAVTSWRYHKDPLETRRPMPKERLPEPPAMLAAGGQT